MRTTRILLSIVLMLAVTAAYSWADSLLYSKDIQITNATGKKVKIKETLNVDPQNARVVITNGLTWPNAKVLKLKVNGTKYIAKKEVNINVDRFETVIPLEASNTLIIVARRKGSAARIKIEIFGTGDSNNGGGGGGGDGGGDGGGGTPDGPVLKRVVGYGDSLLAGFIDGTLLHRYQEYSLGNQLAQQAGTKYNQPLIGEPGNPSLRAEYVNGEIKFYDEQAPGVRMDPNINLHNFSVPGTTVEASLLIKSIGGDPNNDPWQVILGGKKTQIDSVLDRNPSLVLFWLGSNDVLGMALESDPDDHSNLNKFAAAYEDAIKEMQKQDTYILAANIPDITTIAFLLRYDDGFPTLWDLFNIPRDARVLGTVLLDLLISGNIFTIDVTEDDYMTADEVRQIQRTVEDFNAEIKRICDKHNVPLIDVFSLTQEWDRNGVIVAGSRLTTRWRGGIFGLDGIHPTFTAHALLANVFIERINKEWGESIPAINVDDIYWADPNNSGNNRTPGAAADTADLTDADASSIFYLKQVRERLKHRMELIERRKARMRR